MSEPKAAPTDLSGSEALVTGGAGFIGSHLVERLLSLGAAVTVLDDLSHGRADNLPASVRLVVGSVEDRTALEDHVADKDLIFHLAAEATTKESAMGWNDPFHDIGVNAVGTLNVLDAIRHVNRRAHVVVTSSAAVYGQIQYTPIDENHPTAPVSPYGVSKLAAEKYALAYAHVQGLEVSVLRVFNTYGPRDRKSVV